jgi:hypothetical protein
MTFQTTITITPADERYCGDCRARFSGWCAAFLDGGESVYLEQEWESTPEYLTPRSIRHAACLAAEKASRERCCPVCGGSGVLPGGGSPWPCPRCHGDGWIPVEVDHG